MLGASTRYGAESRFPPAGKRILRLSCQATVAHRGVCSQSRNGKRDTEPNPPPGNCRPLGVWMCGLVRVIDSPFASSRSYGARKPEQRKPQTPATPPDSEPKAGISGLYLGYRKRRGKDDRRLGFSSEDGVPLYRSGRAHRFEMPVRRRRLCHGVQPPA
jgi:hypothetical protein